MDVTLLCYLMLYVLVAGVVYWVVKGLLILDILSTDDEEIDIEKDKIQISIACLVVSAVWIIYIPYLLIQITLANRQEN